MIAIADGYDSRTDERADEKVVMVVHYLPRIGPEDADRYPRAVQSLRQVVAVCQSAARCGRFGIHAERTLADLERRAPAG